MYTRPSKAEQCLHNVLKVVEALRHIGVDYDIQVSITEKLCWLFLLILAPLFLLENKEQAKKKHSKYAYQRLASLFCL